ncbi:MAG: GNAT family N-acetyltransferase [Alphaproteobacteria bacterium]
MRYTIRKAHPDDFHDIAKIHVLGWQAAYADIVDNEYLQTLSVEQRAQNWKRYLRDDTNRIYLAINEQNQPVGFSSCGTTQTFPKNVRPEDFPYKGGLLALYLLPEYYRQGIGTALFTRAAQGLKKLGHNAMCTWSLEENIRAQAFYKSMGGREIDEEMITIGPGTFREICFGWDEL